MEGRLDLSSTTGVIEVGHHGDARSHFVGNRLCPRRIGTLGLFLTGEPSNGRVDAQAVLGGLGWRRASTGEYAEEQNPG
jgi:hypothetical protein